MNIENDILRLFNTYIKSKSTFGKIIKVVPTTPQSFFKESIPVIVIRENDNNDDLNTLTLDRLEYGNNLIYQVDIYTKNVIFEGKEYSARDIINELRFLIHDFFREIGFTRESDIPSEYIDITVKRRTLLFSASVNSWNKSIY